MARNRNPTTRMRRSMENSKRKWDADVRSKGIKPGDWVRFRTREDGTSYFTDYEGKTARIKDWDDDGYNHQRAPRNMKVVVEIEPHLSDNPKSARVKLNDVIPLSAMEVIARVSS